jgi:hypothetical protein
MCGVLLLSLPQPLKKLLRLCYVVAATAKLIQPAFLLGNEPLALRDVPLGFLKVLKLLRAILVGSVAHAGLLDSGITVNFSVCVSTFVATEVPQNGRDVRRTFWIGRVADRTGCASTSATLGLRAREKCSQTEWL